MYDGFSKLPGFTAVKQDGLYVDIEDSYFVFVEYLTLKVNTPL